MPALKIERQRPAEQLIEHDAERIHVTSSIDVLAAGVCLLGADIVKRANQRTNLCVKRPGVQTLRGRLGYSKIDDARDRLAVHFRDQDVGGLQIAMNDGFLMSVLNSFAYGNEELESLASIEFVPIAIDGDGHASHILHYEIGAALGG